MRRDPNLVLRILRAIEALPSGFGQHVLELPNADPQDVRDHQDLMKQQGLIRATVHKAGGIVDHVVVLGLTPAGHDFLDANAGETGVAQVPFTVGPYSSDVTRDPAGAPHPGHVQGVSARGMAAGEGLAGGAGTILSEDGTPILSEDAEPSRPSGTWGPGIPQVGNFASPAGASVLTLGGQSLTLKGEPLVLRATGNDAELTFVERRRTIVRNVVTNRMSIELAALSLLSGLDARIQETKANRLNSESLEDLENLRSLVEQFLLVLPREDDQVADATLSIKEGLKRWWTNAHESICERGFNIALFGGGLSICAMGGVLTPGLAVTVGALVGGKTVVDAIKAYADTLTGKKG